MNGCSHSDDKYTLTVAFFWSISSIQTFSFLRVNAQIVLEQLIKLSITLFLNWKMCTKKYFRHSIFFFFFEIGKFWNFTSQFSVFFARSFPLNKQKNDSTLSSLLSFVITIFKTKHIWHKVISLFILELNYTKVIIIPPPSPPIRSHCVMLLLVLHLIYENNQPSSKWEWEWNDRAHCMA